MWKNVVQPDRPRTTIQYGACALHAGQLRLQMHAQIYNTHCFCTATMVTHSCLIVTFAYICLFCCVVFRLTNQTKKCVKFNY
jgi:hypothetical protein